MIERLGYYKNADYDAYETGICVSVWNTINCYKDDIPKVGMGDCFRLSLIDGTLVVEKWYEEMCDFYLVVASSSFRVLKANNYEKEHTHNR